MKDITIEHFEPLKGERLKLSGNGQETSATIVSLNPLTQQAGQSRAPFSVIIETESVENLGQGMFAIEHEKIDAMELFAVPIGPAENGMRYEIIFN